MIFGAVARVYLKGKISAILEFKYELLPAEIVRYMQFHRTLHRDFRFLNEAFTSNIYPQ